MNDDYGEEVFEKQLKEAEDKYKKLEKHIIEDDLDDETIPLLDQHLTHVREEIVELKTILGKFYAC